MRISTSMMFDTGTQNLLQLQSSMYKLQNQMSTGRKLQSPSDDPVASAQALIVGQRLSVNAQFLDNQSNAQSQLASLEERLSAIADIVSGVRVRAQEAGNEGYSDENRKSIAAEIRQRFDELVGLANNADALGDYIFAGARGNTLPFVMNGVPGSRTTSYQGDDGHRQLQVETGRLMDVSESGRDVFMNVPQGNGDFKFAANPANTGTGVVGASSVVTGFDESTYDLVFTGANTYDLTVTTNGVPTTTTGLSYASGAGISLGPVGQQIVVSVSGAPMAGDKFTVSPAVTQDIFKTLDTMIGALEGNVSATVASKAAFKNQLTNIRENLDQAFNHILNKQTAIGARRLELDALTNTGEDLQLQYKQDLSKLQDLDYTQAISDMANQKMVLEAAQLSFKQVSQMSLFNYL